MQICCQSQEHFYFLPIAIQLRPSSLPCPLLLLHRLHLALVRLPFQGPFRRPFQLLQRFDLLLDWLPLSNHHLILLLKCLVQHFQHLQFGENMEPFRWWGITSDLGISCPFLIDHNLTIYHRNLEHIATYFHVEHLCVRLSPATTNSSGVSTPFSKNLLSFNVPIRGVTALT